MCRLSLPAHLILREELLRRRDIEKNKPRGISFLGACRIGGGYLLSHFRSTIGVVRFNFSVRNGKRWNPRAMAALMS